MTETEFYQRDFERRGRPEVLEIGDLERGMRYKPVVDWLLKQERKPKLLELGYGGPQVFGIYEALTESFTLVDVLDRTHGVSFPKQNVEIFNLNHDWKLEDESFDVVIACMIFEHLFDPFHSFENLSRVMKRGGVSFVNLPLVTSVKHRMVLLFGGLPTTSSKDWFENREWDGGHLHCFTIPTVKRCAKLYGLSIRSIFPCGRLYKLKTLWPSLFCSEVTFMLEKT